MNFYKKLGEVRPNQLITTYGPGSIMDAVNDSLTVLDIEYWDTNNIGKEIRDRLYRRLHHQMNCMSLEKKLELINFWIFKYTENYYMSPDVQTVIDADDKLKELSRDNNGNPNLGYVTTMDYLFPRDEIKPEEVTNLLSEIYAVKK